MDNMSALENLVRVGIVSAIDSNNRKARVRFDDMGITSGWLFVVQHYEAGIFVDPDGRHVHDHTVTTEPNHTHSAPVSIDPAGAHLHVVTETTEPDHDHQGTHLTNWMPKVGGRVLVLYIPVFNGDGFILGGL